MKTQFPVGNQSLRVRCSLLESDEQHLPRLVHRHMTNQADF